MVVEISKPVKKIVEKVVPITTFEQVLVEREKIIEVPVYTIHEKVK